MEFGCFAIRNLELKAYTYAQLEKAEQLWKDAYRAAEKSANKSGRTESSRDTMSYSMKEDSKRGEAKEENRKAFVERGTRRGYSFFNGETAVYGYKAVQGRNASQNARQVQRELNALGLDCAIFEGVIEWNVNGKTRQKRSDETVTIEDSFIQV